MSENRAVVGRGAKVIAAVHEAALEELLDKGFAALTMEAVAQRAGVHKTTVYRRWGDRQSLVVDVLSGQFAASMPAPDTGSFEDDLHLLAQALVASVSGGPGAAMRAAMFSDAGRLPEVGEACRRVFADRLRRTEHVVRRAVDRGELPAEVDPVEVLSTLAAQVYFRLQLTELSATGDCAERSVRVVLAAARDGALA